MKSNDDYWLMKKEKKLNTKKRDEKLDIIRIFSLFCVISVHFFLNSDFYDEIVCGKKMLIALMLRSFFIICVPMFITLTGYLMNKKELNHKYYKGLIKILIIYFICSIIYTIFQKIYLNKNISFMIFLKNLLSYCGTKYSWYIEMYIGLFLLIPFLNLIFNNLKSKNHTRVLLGTLAFIIGLPSITNIFRFEFLSAFNGIFEDGEYFKIFPNWWKGIYPIFYYFLGAYLSKYKIELGIKCNIISLIIIIVLDGIFNYIMSYSKNFVYGTWNDYSSATIMIITFLMFNLLLKVNFKKENKIRSNMLKIFSDACLGAYLISCIFDNVYYDKLKIFVPIMKDRFIYAPVMILLVFISSLIVSIVINIFYKMIYKIIKTFNKYIYNFFDKKCDNK